MEYVYATELEIQDACKNYAEAEQDAFADRTNRLCGDRKEYFETDAEYLYRTLRLRVRFGFLAQDAEEYISSQRKVRQENLAAGNRNETA